MCPEVSKVQRKGRMSSVLGYVGEFIRNEANLVQLFIYSRSWNIKKNSACGFLLLLNKSSSFSLVTCKHTYFLLYKIFDHKVVSAVTKIMKLSKSKILSSNLFFHDRCVHRFTPKRISPDCLFKCNHNQVKISILNPRCAIYLRGMLQNAETTLWSNISTKSETNSKIL